MRILGQATLRMVTVTRERPTEIPTPNHPPPSRFEIVRNDDANAKTPPNPTMTKLLGFVSPFLEPALSSMSDRQFSIWRIGQTNEFIAKLPLSSPHLIGLLIHFYSILVKGRAILRNLVIQAVWV